jgi:drug/metabolite transporter (DMT)-like permease
VTRRSWIGLLVLAALWGASYLFIKLALEELSPAAVVFGRLALAALVLLPLALARGALRGIVEAGAPVLLLALI